MKFIPAILSLLLFSNTLVAQPDIQITGKSEHLVPTQHNTDLHSINTSPTKNHAQSSVKSITVLDAKLSDNAWETLTNRVKTSKLDPTPRLPSPGPSRTQLGMNDVPVFEQGNHGSCAMFAATAAIDAALGKGDYISQLCQLQLGQYLERLGYLPSGWEGSSTPLVLHQLRAFGFINTTEQHETGCGEYTDYPTYGDTPETDMSLSAFHEISEPFPNARIDWSSVLDEYRFRDHIDPQRTLNTVKTALQKGDRLTLGVLLLGLEEGVIGAVGSHHEPNDTWMLTPRIIQAVLTQANVGHHAMIITGFDDDGIALDAYGTPHKGLLTLRNSWGSDVGDHGDFYMTYDYFMLLANEIQRIRLLRHPMM